MEDNKKNKNKKIVFINSSLTQGGSERVMTLIANFFSEHDYDTTMILLRDKERKNYILNPNINCIQLIYGTKNKAIILLKRFFKVRKLLKEIKPEYIISFMWDINIFSLIANLGLKSKIIISERSHPKMGRQNFTRVFGQKHIYKLADRIVLQTDDVKEFYTKTIQKKCTVIPNPMNENLPHRFEGKRKKIICAVGRLRKQKNFEMLINAFSEFYKTHNDYKMVIYGEGRERKNLEKQISELNLENIILLPGYVDNVNEQMVDCMMYVSSSDYEGISNSMLEALGMGIPTISTDCPVGGARLAMKGKNNGILIDVNDKKALVNAMKFIADNKEEAEKFSKEAVKTKEEYSIDKIGKMWINLCDEL